MSTRTRNRRLATCYVAIASIAAAVAVAPASASFPGHNGVIVFSSGRKDGSLEIFSMRPNGSSVTRLTRDHPFGSRPTWSPDGKRIAFIAGSYAGTELWAMRRDGTGLVRLARGAADETPAWSPNGRRIAFACPAGRHETALCLVRSNGAGRKRITRPRGHRDGHPTWSPDGKEIAFNRSAPGPAWLPPCCDGDILALKLRTGRVRRLTKTRRGSYALDPSWSRQGRIAYENGARLTSNIFVMRPDGSGKRNVTRTRGLVNYASDPSWSPNGKQIVFDGGYDSFFVINADGSGRHRLAFDTGAYTVSGYVHPAWSPDGGKIAFDDSGDIWLGNPDGSGAEPRMRGDWAEQPAVTADGSTIAFHSARGEFVMNWDGTNLRELSGDYWSGGVDGPGGGHPSWSPDGQRLAVEITDDAGYVDGINLVNIDGSHYDSMTALTGWPSNEGEPAWSPDGTRIAFTADYGRGNDVCVFVLATSQSGCLTGRGRDSEPTWSPDGTKIAFARGNGIDVMDANGKGVHKLIANASQPAWSPDGTKIAFVRYLGRNSEIYVVNVNGTGLKRLTHNPGPDLYPDWQPVDANNHLVDPLAPSDG